MVNDAVGDADRIRRLVGDGYLVRTRADSDTVEARSGDTTVQEAAWASGAQFVSTDYVFPDDMFGTGYVAEVPGPGLVRCNPVLQPRPCPKRASRPDGGRGPSPNVAPAVAQPSVPTRIVLTTLRRMTRLPSGHDWMVAQGCAPGGSSGAAARQPHGAHLSPPDDVQPGTNGDRARTAVGFLP